MKPEIQREREREKAYDCFISIIQKQRCDSFEKESVNLYLFAVIKGKAVYLF